MPSNKKPARGGFFILGWMMGFEPTTTGITIQDSTAELHPPLIFAMLSCGLLVRPTGLEPVTPGLEGRCSIQMSYGRKMVSQAILAFALRVAPQTHFVPDEMVGVEGFEPTTPCSQSRCATRLRYTPKVSRIRQKLHRNRTPAQGWR